MPIAALQTQGQHGTHLGGVHVSSKERCSYLCPAHNLDSFEERLLKDREWAKDTALY